MANELGFSIEGSVENALLSLDSLIQKLNVVDNAFGKLVSSVQEQSAEIAENIRNIQSMPDAKQIPDYAYQFQGVADATSVAGVQQAMLQNRLQVATQNMQDQYDEVKELAFALEELSAQSKGIDLNTPEGQAASQQMQAYEMDINRAYSAMSRYQAQVNSYNSQLNAIARSSGGAANETGGLANETERAGSSARRGAAGWEKMLVSIKNITFYRLVRGAIKALMNDVITGFQNLAQWSAQFEGTTGGAFSNFNKNISLILSDMVSLKNAFAAAAEPIINVLTPALDFLISKIAEAFNWIGALMAALTGKSVYTKAVKNVGDYAASLNSASKAQKNFLAGFDELNVVPSQSASAAGGKNLGIDTSEMFETKQVSDSAKAFAEPFRDTFATLKGVWDEFSGNIVNNAKSAWQGLIDVATFVDQAFNSLFSGENSSGALVFAGILQVIESALNFIGLALRDVILPLLAGIWETLKPFIDAIGDTLYLALLAVAGMFNELSAAISDNETGTQSLWETIGQVVGIVLGAISVFFALKGVLFVLSNPIGAIIALLTFFNAIFKLANSSGNIFVSVLAGIIPVAGLVIGMILGLINPFTAIIAIIGVVILWFKNLYDTNEKFREFVDKIVAGAKMLIPGIKQGILDGWSDFISFWSGLWDKIVTAFKNFFGIHSPSTLFAGFGQMLLFGLKNGMFGAIGIVISVIWNMRDQIENAIGNLISSAWSWGSDFMQGFKSGIDSFINGVIDSVSGLANKIKRLLHFSSPDEGPLADYETWMPDFMQGLAKGINNNAYRVTDSIKALTDNMSGTFNVPVTGLVSGVSANVTGAATTSALQSQADSNAGMADVVWQAAMAVVEAVAQNKTTIQIGDDVIGKSAQRYNARAAMVNG